MVEKTLEIMEASVETNLEFMEEPTEVALTFESISAAENDAEALEYTYYSYW